MIRVAICDDNKIFLELLMKMIQKKFIQYDIQSLINCFLSGKSFLRIHRKEPFDIVFLDIAMPEMDGFAIADEIRKNSERTYIIFITTESELVYESLDYRPFHFIPKTTYKLIDSRLDHVINKLMLHMYVNKTICLDLPYGEKKFLAPDSIIFVKNNANYLDFETIVEEVISVRGNMNSVTKILSSHLFVRVHNRYLVNMKHIGRIDYPNSEILMDNDKKINISRAYKKPLEEAYNLFLQDFS